MGIINRSRHSLQIRVFAGLLVALPGQVVLPSFYSQAHAQQLSSREDGLLAKAVQEDSTFQESHKELRDLPTTVDTSATPAAAPAEATEQGSPLRRRRAAGFVPTTLAQAGSSGGTTSTYGSSSTTTMGGDPNRTLFQGLALFGAVAGGAGLGLGISNATGGGRHNRIIIISGSR
jgi:hypothetical protein